MPSASVTYSGKYLHMCVRDSKQMCIVYNTEKLKTTQMSLHKKWVSEFIDFSHNSIHTCMNLKSRDAWAKSKAQNNTQYGSIYLCQNMQNYIMLLFEQGMCLSVHTCTVRSYFTLSLQCSQISESCDFGCKTVTRKGKLHKGFCFSYNESAWSEHHTTPK